MEKLAEKIKNAVCDSNPGLTSEQADTIKFGLECTFSEMSKILIYFVVFSFFSLTGYYLVALIFFCAPRIFAGGFHANTYLQCFIITFSTLSIGILAGSQFNLPLAARILLLVMSIVLACVYAPVDHPNKPIISIKRRKHFKYLSVAAFIILSGLTFLLKEKFAATAAVSLFLEGISLPIGQITNRRILT